jgi:hypothetical protein
MVIEPLMVPTSKDGVPVLRLAYPQLAQACALIDEVLADRAARNARLFVKPADEEGARVS